MEVRTHSFSALLGRRTKSLSNSGYRERGYATNARVVGMSVCPHSHSHAHAHLEEGSTLHRAEGSWSFPADGQQAGIHFLFPQTLWKRLAAATIKTKSGTTLKSKSCHRSSPVATSMACYRKQAGFLPIYQYSGSVQSRQSHARCPANTQGSRLGSPWELTAASGGFRTMRRRGRGCV